MTLAIAEKFTLENLPGKLRVFACVGPRFWVEMSPDLALGLARKLERVDELQVQVGAYRDAHDSAKRTLDEARQIARAAADLARKVPQAVASSLIVGFLCGAASVWVALS